ncbi:hypothetical protein EX30DRAFT_227054, partial [Ascodesmis nigricans]
SPSASISQGESSSSVPPSLSDFPPFPLHPHPRVRARKSTKRLRHLRELPAHHPTPTTPQSEPDASIPPSPSPQEKVKQKINRLLEDSHLLPAAAREILHSPDITAIMSIPATTTTIEKMPPGIPLTPEVEELMKRKILQLEHDLNQKNARCTRLERRVEVLTDVLLRERKYKQRLLKDREEMEKQRNEVMRKGEMELESERKMVEKLKAAVLERDGEMEKMTRRLRVIKEELDRLRMSKEQ